jgi:hypothetical protein
MVAEVFAGLSALKTAFDMAKGLKDINDAVIRNGAVIELQEQILSAQQTQSTLLERIGTLEKEVASFETWDAEKQKYKLYHLGWAAYAFMLKPEARGTEPPHHVCANCFAKRQISIIQHARLKRGGMGTVCPACDTELVAEPATAFGPGGVVKWLD